MANISKRVILPPGLGTYAFIWEARNPPAGSTGDPKFSITLVWPKAEVDKSLADLRGAVREVAAQAFGKDWEKLVKAGKLKLPLRDGDLERPDDPTFQDSVFITAKSSGQPGIVDAKVKPIFEKEEAYSGCTFRASVSIFAYDNVSKGVGVGLSNLQVVRKGPRLDGRKAAEDEFKDFAEEAPAKPFNVTVDDLT